MNAVVHFAYFGFLRFVKDGVNFSINSDDPLICQTRMDLEQGVAFNQIGLSPAELTRAVSCLSETKRVKLIRKAPVHSTPAEFENETIAGRFTLLFE